MPEEELRVWRAGPVTLVLISIFAVAAGIVIPVLAYLIYRNGSSPWLPALLIVLTVLALLYVWRFGFHPRLRVTETADVEGRQSHHLLPCPRRWSHARPVVPAPDYRDADPRCLR